MLTVLEAANALAGMFPWRCAYCTSTYLGGNRCTSCGAPRSFAVAKVHVGGATTAASWTARYAGPG